MVSCENENNGEGETNMSDLKENDKRIKCPKCHSPRIETKLNGIIKPYIDYVYCLDCGYEWWYHYE